MAIAKKIGGADVIQTIALYLKDESEALRLMVVEAVDQVIRCLGVNDIDDRLEETLIDGML